MIKTIIIGGGVSGLACGKRLQELGEDFVLISDTLGGRMFTDKETKVNYGASYVTSEYHNVLGIVETRGRIHAFDVGIFEKGRVKNPFLDLKLLFHMFAILKIALDLYDFKSRLSKFRERCNTVSQKDALLQDSILERYTKINALEYVEKNRLAYLHTTYFNAFVKGTFFTDAKDLNLFYYFTSLVPTVTKTFMPDFSETVEKLTKGWKDKIIQKKVIHVEKLIQGGWEVKTADGSYVSANVVLATPIISYLLPSFSLPDVGVPIYVYHVYGFRRTDFSSHAIISFSDKDEILLMWRENTGNDIIFSKSETLDLSAYYSEHSLVKKIFWNPAVTISNSSQWVEQVQGGGLYFASDSNLCGLEDAYIAGLFAANKIAGK